MLSLSAAIMCKALWRVVVHTFSFDPNAAGRRSNKCYMRRIRK